MRETRIYIILFLAIALSCILGPESWQLAAENKAKKPDGLELKLDSTFKKAEDDVMRLPIADSIKAIAIESSIYFNVLFAFFILVSNTIIFSFKFLLI